MKLIIAGSRNFSDYLLLKKNLDKYLSNVKKEDVEIVSGSASGADKLGEKYAAERGYKITSFPADWKQYGRAAGPIRNSLMADYATDCICFWDGQSKGTKWMIDLCAKKNVSCKVILTNRYHRIKL